MKIILINTPMMQVYGKFKPAAKRGAEIVTPLGLAYVASVVEKAGHTVRLIDADAENLSQTGIMQIIKKEPVDVVGVTATTPVYPGAKSIIEAVKAYDENIATIIGGAHVTILPESVMSESKADIGIIREGEITAVELLSALENGNSLKGVKGIIFKENGKLITTEPRPLITDLDSIPFPARYLLKGEYLWSVPGVGLTETTTMLTQRGCPFSCVFCSAGTISGKQIRYRSVENTIEEIDHIVNDLGIKYIFFADDTFTMDQERTKNLCANILGKGLKFGWDATTRANVISRELLSDMKAAGLKRISFGIESGDQTILNAIKKGTTLEQLSQAYQWCKELEIETRGSVMIGNPFETRETIKNTSRFINSLKCNQVYINIAMPYPGSELYAMARESIGGLKLLTDDWREYRRYGNSVMEVNDLTIKDLIKAQRSMYLRFYFRPTIVWYNLRRAGFKAALVNAWAFIRSLF